VIDKAIRRRVKSAGLASYWLRRCLAPYSSLAEKGQLILDIGSGDSPYRDLWQHARYLAIDLTNKEADALSNIYNLPVKSDCADMAICTEVLEHVFDTSKALTELHRVLKPGGWLVLSTPFIMGEHEAQDYYRFTPACLAKHIHTNGFETTEISTRGGIFSCLGLLATHLPSQVISRHRLNSADRSESRVLSTIPSTLWLCLALIFQISLRFLAHLDRFDSKKHFTLGYVVVCSKRR
jgi:SAM-dependent methyltransferase